MNLPYDIDRRLRLEYSPHEVMEIHTAFEELQREEVRASARVFRCVIHLADGNVRRLLDLVENARRDYRDVIFWAEYDERGKKRLHDFNRSF